MTDTSEKILWSLLGILLMVLSGTVLYKAWPILFPELTSSAAVDPACDLRAGPCRSTLAEGGSISLSIQPHSIPLVEPLTLEVELGSLVARQVEVDFSGVDMYMGYNRVKLNPLGNGRFRGEARIPVCVRDAMEWEAKVLVQTDRGLIAAPYRFITVKPDLAK